MKDRYNVLEFPVVGKLTKQPDGSVLASGINPLPNIAAAKMPSRTSHGVSNTRSNTNVARKATRMPMTAPQTASINLTVHTRRRKSSNCVCNVSGNANRW